MPRIARGPTGEVVHHVVNRGNARATVFHDEDDYAAFVELLGQACDRWPMRVVGCCLMPNHFHLVVWPAAAGDLSRWMQWLMTSHVRRHHRRHGTSGHVWQGRYKSFPVQPTRVPTERRLRGVLEGGDAVLAVLRYVERNPVRSGLATSAEDWAWSSARWWAKVEAAPAFWRREWFARPADWLEQVNRPQRDEELAALRRCVRRGRPFGRELWVKQMARQWGLESTLRPRGRPRKHARYPKK
jgi:putative transposase